MTKSYFTFSKTDNATICFVSTSTPSTKAFPNELPPLDLRKKPTPSSTESNKRKDMGPAVTILQDIQGPTKRRRVEPKKTVRFADDIESIRYFHKVNKKKREVETVVFDTVDLRPMKRSRIEANTPTVETPIDLFYYEDDPIFIEFISSPPTDLSAFDDGDPDFEDYDFMDSEEEDSTTFDSVEDDDETPDTQVVEPAPVRRRRTTRSSVPLRRSPRLMERLGSIYDGNLRRSARLAASGR